METQCICTKGPTGAQGSHSLGLQLLFCEGEALSLLGYPEELRLWISIKLIS